MVKKYEPFWGFWAFRVQIREMKSDLIVFMAWFLRLFILFKWGKESLLNLILHTYEKILVNL